MKDKALYADVFFFEAKNMAFGLFHVFNQNPCKPLKQLSTGYLTQTPSHATDATARNTTPSHAPPPSSGRNSEINAFSALDVKMEQM